jgi:hypothetical protein
VIQRSDQKLGSFRTGTLVSCGETSTSPSTDSTSTPRKTASGNSSKILRVIHDRIKSYGPFEQVLWCGETRPPLHRQAIPHLLHGNLRPETPVKIWWRSNGRIKSYSPFEPVLWSGATRPSPHRVPIPVYSKENGVQKLFYNFEGDPWSDQKLGSFRTCTLVWSGETSALPSSDSTSNPRKTASGNSSIILRVIHGRIKS